MKLIDGSQFCKIHGLLSEGQWYVHRHNGRIDFECKQCINIRLTKRYHANSTEISKSRKLRYPRIRKKILKRMVKFYKINTDLVKSKTHNYRLNIKKEVLDHYGTDGAKCAVCGETKLNFLCLDHINNDGAEHRRKFNINSQYLWAKRNKYPPVFQVLCHNHNIIKYIENLDPPKFPLQKEKEMKLKLEVFSHYSGGMLKCALCEESNLRALTIDHINGDGASHRRKLKKMSRSPKRIYLYLKKEGYPIGFRVLCQNHNLGSHCIGE